MSVPVDLSEVIDKKQTFGLNVSDKFPFTNLFIKDNRILTRSDSDEQMLFIVSFNEAVMLQGIKFVAAHGAEKEAPKRIKLYINQVNFSFDDVDSIPPTQVLDLTSKDVGEESKFTPLKQVVFSRLNSVTVFIETNQTDSEHTTLGGLLFFGKALGSTKVELKKVTGEE